MTRRNHRNNNGFQCLHCGQFVPERSHGTQHRNHCPWCLWSRHVDEHVGDRQSPCRAEMEPLAVAVRDAGEWTIVHRCTRCGSIRTNRIAGDDQELALLQLALRPLANPPFPLDHLPVTGRR